MFPNLKELFIKHILLYKNRHSRLIIRNGFDKYHCVYIITCMYYNKEYCNYAIENVPSEFKTLKLKKSF